MGPVATAVAVGCLLALRWLLWIAAALLLVLIVVQRARADPDAQPLAEALLALGFVLAGGVSGFLARRL